MQPTMYQICVRGRICEQRVPMTLDNLGALITPQRHRHNLEEPDASSPMSPTASSIRLRRRATTMAAASNAGRRLCPSFGASERMPRWTRCRRSRINSTRRSPSAVPSGCRLALRAVRRRWRSPRKHATGGCNRMGLRPDGDLAEKLCQACLATVQCAMTTYVDRTCEMASRWDPPGVHHPQASHSIPAQCLRCAPDGSEVVPS